jgi:hypothetical protein
MDFIAIKINDEYLDLPPNTVINMEIENPFFDDGNIKGILSLPFNLFQTKQNKKVFGLPEILGNKRVTRVFDCKLYLGGPNGSLWLSGLFRIRNITDGRYVCNLNAQAATLAEAVRNKTLSQLEYDGIRNIVPQRYISIKLTGSGTTGSVTIQVGPSGTYAKTAPFNTSITQTLEDLAALFLAEPLLADADISDVVVKDGNRILFYLTVPVTFTQFEELGSSAGPGRALLEDDFYNILDVRDHVNETMDEIYPSVDYAFFPIKNPDAYESNSEYQGYINYYHDGSIAVNHDLTGDSLKFPICLFPYMLYVLKKIFEEHDFTHHGSFLEGSEIKRLVIYNNYLLDDFALGDFSVNFNRWARQFNIQNHVPDISIGEFLKALKNFFSLGFFFDFKKNDVEIIPLKEILQSKEYDDMTHMCEPNNDIEMREGDGFTIKYERDGNDELVAERLKSLTGYNLQAEVVSVADLPAASAANVNDVRLVASINQYYKSNATYSSSATVYEWEYYADNINDYVYGNGKQPIVSTISTLSTYNPEEIVILPDKNWLVPYVKQVCNSVPFNQSGNNFSFRILFYRGFYTDSLANLYPLGIPYNYNWNRSQIGNYSLGADGAFGMYENWNKELVEFLTNARPVTKKVRWTLPELLSLKMQRKKRILNKNYIIKKISLPITMKGLGVSTVEYYST